MGPEGVWMGSVAAAHTDSTSLRSGGGSVTDRAHELGWELARPLPGRDRTVVVVDDRRLIREALATLLGAGGRFTVTACAAGTVDGDDVAALEPDVVLVGVGQTMDDQLEFIVALHRAAPEVATVILAESNDAELIRCVLDQGVGALISTDSTVEDLEFTLEQVLRGLTALPAGWQRILSGDDGDPVAELSARQLEVLRLLADGFRYEEIAERLIITVNTVKFHVRSIYMRLGVSNRMAAAKLLAASRSGHAHPN